MNHLLSFIALISPLALKAQSEKYPLISADPALICDDTSYMNAEGKLTKGTRPCENEANETTECSYDKQIACLTTTTYIPVLTSEIDEENIKSGAQIGGTDGIYGRDQEDLEICATDGQIQCLTNSSFKSCKASLLIESNIRQGITIGSVMGSMIPGPPSCSTQGSQNCQANGSYFAANTCSSNGSGCYLPAYISSSQPLKAISYDSIANNLSKLKSTFSIAGLTGTLSDCNANGLSACVATNSFKSADLSNLTSNNIRSTINVAGTTGNIVASPATCSANGQQSCVTSGLYFAGQACTSNDSDCYLPSYVNGTQPLKAISFEHIQSNLSSIVNTISFAGLSGTLNICNTNNTSGCVTDSIYRSADWANLSAENIKSTITIAGVMGTYAAPTGPAACSSNGQQNCMANDAYFAGTECTEDASNCYLPSYLSSTKPLKAISFDSLSAQMSLVKNTLTLGGLSGSLLDCTANNTSGCITNASYQAADWTNLSATNIKSGIILAGVTGSYAFAPPACSSAGQQNCVASGLNYAGMICTNLASGCYLPAYVASTQALKAISFDAINSGAGSFRSSLSLAGVSGTLADCNTNGASDCVTTTTYKSANLTNLLAGNIANNVNIAGVTGNVLAALPNCSSNGQQNCTAQASYFAGTICSANGSGCFLPTYTMSSQPLKAISYDLLASSLADIRTQITISGLGGTLADCAGNNLSGCVTTSTMKATDWTNLTAANIKSAVVVAGLTGTYPSSTNNLTGTDSTPALDFATFNAKIKSSANFLWFGPDGTKHIGSGNTNITVSNILNNVTIFGTTGSLAGMTSCTATDQSTCIADSACLWSSGTCSVNAWNLRIGTAIGSVTGSLKTHCKNRANSSVYNIDTLPPGNAAGVSGTVVNTWDTIDDFNANAGTIPPTIAAAFNSNTDCYTSIWEEATLDGACDSNGDDCMMRDKITGLVWSESIPTTGAAPSATTTGTSWSVHVNACDGLSYGGRSDWRLPTQKELMTLYVHGVRAIGYNGAGTVRGAGTLDNNDFFLTNTDTHYVGSSTSSSTTTSTYSTDLGGGPTPAQAKTALLVRLCVAP